MILTLLFTTFFLQKGYFWAPLKMPTVPSSHCKRTGITNTVQIQFSQSSTWILEFLVSNWSPDHTWKVCGVFSTKKVLDCDCTVFVMQSKILICYRFWRWWASVCHKYLTFISLYQNLGPLRSIWKAPKSKKWLSLPFLKYFHIYTSAISSTESK